MRWRHESLPRDRVRALSRELGVSEVLAELLLRVPVGTAAEARTFLGPRLADLTDPFLLTGMNEAVERLSTAIDRLEAVTVFGDYDVDGVTSTALLVSMLRHFGLKPHYVVPRRLEEGYGLSRDAIDRALTPGEPSLFVALDCGTNSVDEVAYLRGRGVDVVILDHHRSREETPADCVLVNPHVHGDTEGGAQCLCAVGLVFKLVHALLKKRRDLDDARAYEIRLKDHLDLVAMGTVADLVPLVRENRILAWHGLQRLGRTERPGLRELMVVAGMEYGEEPRPVDVSFRLGPRINASGRLADAALSVELLLSRETSFCREAAGQLDAFNRERQDIERQITEHAFQIIETQMADARGIVVYDGEWHPGVVGVVASRLTRKYHRPCIVLGREGDLAKGSGRSIAGFNLVEVLGPCGHLLKSWGGHPMAVGISLRAENVPAFQAAFDVAVKAASGGDVLQPEIEIAAWVPFDEIRDRLLEEIETLHPFGQQNPEPILASPGVIFDTPCEVFKEQHFRFQLHTLTGRRVSGVAWNMNDRLPPVGRPVDIAFQLQWNRFNGRKWLQIDLQDWRESVR